MKFLHLADLHLGKMLHGVSLLENGDQKDWVQKLLALVEAVRPDAVVIAGDVYDRAMPSAEATQLLSQLVTAIARVDIPVLIAAGNHDSGPRLACFQEVLSRQNVYIAGEQRRELTHVTLQDAHGPVTFWLLPYTFPAAVSQLLGDDTIRDYDTAIRLLLAQQMVDYSQRNVIVAHQNVTKGGVDGPRGGSESTVGGVGQVDYTAFDGFDYVALGHIHAAYAVGRPTVRYAGSPLCYHFDEVRQAQKGPLLVELGQKGAEVKTQTLVIPPLHPLRVLRGTYAELLQQAANTGQGEYVKLVLTEERWTVEKSAPLEAVLREHGNLLLERTSEGRFFAGPGSAPDRREVENKAVEELFASFYTERTGSAPDAGDAALMACAAELLRHSDPGADGKQVDPALADKVLHYCEKEAQAL